MARRKTAVSSRNRGHRLLRWLLLVTAGLGGGLLLGEMAAENLRVVIAGAGTSYSEFSANPDASMPVALSQSACLDCPDSYDVAARMHAARDTHMDDAFRELGAVDTNTPPSDEPGDAYHYGGRFSDSAPAPEAENTVAAADPADHDTVDRPLLDVPPP